MSRAAEQCSAAAAVADSEEFEEVESCIEIEVMPEERQREEAQLSASLAGDEVGSPPVTAGSVPDATAAASRPPMSMAAGNRKAAHAQQETPSGASILCQ